MAEPKMTTVQLPAVLTLPLHFQQLVETCEHLFPHEDMGESKVLQTSQQHLPGAFLQGLCTAPAPALQLLLEGLH